MPLTPVSGDMLDEVEPVSATSRRPWAISPHAGARDWLAACGTRATRSIVSWSRTDGLIKLVDTAVAHLFKELFYRETGEWPGEEAPHAAPKREPRASHDPAARGEAARLPEHRRRVRSIRRAIRLNTPCQDVVSGGRTP